MCQMDWYWPQFFFRTTHPIACDTLHAHVSYCINLPLVLPPSPLSDTIWHTANYEVYRTASQIHYWNWFKVVKTSHHGASLHFRECPVKQHNYRLCVSSRMHWEWERGKEERTQWSSIDQKTMWLQQDWEGFGSGGSSDGWSRWFTVVVVEEEEEV